MRHNSRRNTKVFSNKKGSILDILFIAIGVTILGIVLLVMFMISSNVNAQFSAQSIVPQESKDATAKVVSLFPGILDKSMLFLTIGLAIGAFILAALVRIHPIFIPLYIITLIIIIFLAGMLSNMYQEMAARPEFAGFAAQLIITNQILTALPLIVGVLGTILMIVQYKIWSNQ